LGGKLGPILWQFAPSITLEGSAFADFLELLPDEIDSRPLRHVVELRDSGFVDEAILALLRRRRIALARVDDDRFPAFSALTAGFVYARLRRCAASEPAGYPPAAIERWADAFRELSADGRDCFVYFINGAKVRAPAAAEALLRRLG
jgi:uncharacterized protein YecE (DUF72 family)